MSNDSVVLEALRRDRKRLEKVATKAKKECDERMSVGSDIIAVYEEFNVALKSGIKNEEMAEVLKDLTAREARAKKVMRKDLVKLIDKECEARFALDRIISEISMCEFRLNR